MNVPAENIIVNSCEYTPIYLIPSTSVTQAGSYIITQSNQDARKPVADNLKTYYENSGNLESGILSSPKPRILKKQNSSVVGNNLKLASFLLPKTESINVTNIANLTPVQPQPTVQTKQPIPAMNNVIVKPPVTTVTTAINNVDNSLPRVEVDRKIVRVGTIPSTRRTHFQRSTPKNKRLITTQKELKEKISIKTLHHSKTDPDLSKHTSVQLIKLGETYHSLNQLSDAQVKIVNKALKMFGDPKEPAYDPVTNTKFIYKVVSPRDLTVVGRNKNVVMKKKAEVKKQKVVAVEEPIEEEPIEVPAQPKVTRSGRTVKMPKQMRTNCESPHKPKKKVGSVVNCFQCSAEFCSFYRLQRHYETYPTHIPARIHSNLFHCLLAIIKGGSDDDQANIFIQQLEQLIEKIKTLLPCLLKKIDGKEVKQCTINDDIGRLFGMNPGKYNLNMDALSCMKDKDGHCIHNPAPKPVQINTDAAKASQIRLTKHNEEIANNEANTEDCARINSVDKWPNVTKRIWKLKQQKQQRVHAKKMRLASENEQPIELGTEDLMTFSIDNENRAINVVQSDVCQEIKEEIVEVPLQEEIIEIPLAFAKNQDERPKTHAQFHSAHFDIRSSPIKLPSSLVRKFQLHPDKMTNFEVQIMRPLATDENDVDKTHSNSELQCNDLNVIFRDSIELPKETTMNNELNFDTPKSWQMTDSNDSTGDTFMKSNILFETGLTPEKNVIVESSLLQLNNKQPSLFDTPSKSNDLIEINLLEMVEKSNRTSIIEPSLIHSKPNGIFTSNPTLAHTNEQHNGFYDSSSMHVKPKCNSLIGSSMIQIKDKAFESALSHVKERSNNLFEESLLQTENKSNNLMDDKHDSYFDTGLSHAKERSISLFESSLLDMKDKDLLDPSLLHDDNSNLFNPSISHPKDDSLMQQTLVHENASSLNAASLLHKDVRNSINIDMHQDQGSNLSTSDSRLLNPSQSVLNFLDSLGNESLGLSYPETEIRNNTVDFQLDLFSFSNS